MPKGRSTPIFVGRLNKQSVQGTIASGLHLQVMRVIGKKRQAYLRLSHELPNSSKEYPNVSSGITIERMQHRNMFLRNYDGASFHGPPRARTVAASQQNEAVAASPENEAVASSEGTSFKSPLSSSSIRAAPSRPRHSTLFTQQK